MGRPAREGEGAAGGSVRAFFALEPGEEARRELAALAARLAGEPGGDGVRWVRPEAYHVTLRFLGETPAAGLGGLIARVEGEAAGCAPFALRLGGLHAFPTPHRPRVVVVDLEPAGGPADALAELAAAVERAAVAAGFPPERRRFRGHVTLGRVRGRRAPRLAGGCAPAAFPVDSFVLFRSVLGEGGSRYLPLERIPLGGRSSSRSPVPKETR